MHVRKQAINQLILKNYDLSKRDKCFELKKKKQNRSEGKIELG